MTDTAEIIAFVCAQLDEDERVATGVGDNESARRWHRRAEVDYDGCVLDADGDVVVYDEGSPTAAEAEHITRHDPARVLAEVDAKRRILDVVDGWRHYACQDGWYSCSQATEANGFEVDMACADEDRAGEPCDCGLDARKRAIAAPLALPYADRTGYHEEWQV